MSGVGRIMSNELFAAALGVEKPWYVKDVSFDAGKRLLTIAIDFKKGSRFPYQGCEGLHPVHDTQTKRYRHLSFFQHECYLEVRTPRLKLPDSRVVLETTESRLDYARDPAQLLGRRLPQMLMGFERCVLWREERAPH